jgi:hypothetical protein
MNRTTFSTATALTMATAMLVATSLLALGCNRQDEQQSEPARAEGQASDVAAAAATSLSDEAEDQQDLAVEEDFEDEAYAAIDEDNLETQVDALEKEISTDAD